MNGLSHEVFEQAWAVLKAHTSYRMGDKSPYSTEHLPTEFDHDAVIEHLSQNEGTTLGDLIPPYLQGEFTRFDSEIGTQPRSYQREPLQFPLTQEEANEVMSHYQSDGGYSIPPSMSHRRGREGSGYGQLGDNRELHPSYGMIGNTIRTLQGRLRQNPDIDFTPQRTQGGSGKRGVTAESFANRNAEYMNTPVGVMAPDPTMMEGDAIAPTIPMEPQGVKVQDY
tara:strand:+ start:21 stop:692 length:672 start_codon:yes stop_codon:yes gene_type:complete